MRKNKYLLLLSLRACLTVVLVFFASSICAQDIIVKGTVKDTNGEPIIGASVQVQGTRTGVITNVDGNYTVKCSLNATLAFSSIGYKAKTLIVDVKKLLMLH